MDEVDGLDDDLDEIAQLFEDRIPLYIDYGIGFITALMSLTVTAGLFATLCGTPFRKNLMIVLATIVLLLFCPLISFELTFSLAVADFCHGLDDTLLEVADKFAPEASLDLINFYVTCEGTNPIKPYANESEIAIDNINDLLDSVDGSNICSSSTVTTLEGAVSSADTALDVVLAKLSCSSLNPLLTRLTHKFVCLDIIDGLYNLWSVQLTCALVLWILLFLTRCEILKRITEDKHEVSAAGALW